MRGKTQLVDNQREFLILGRPAVILAGKRSECLVRLRPGKGPASPKA
jgi:hypothetical protein